MGKGANAMGKGANAHISSDMVESWDVTEKVCHHVQDMI